MFPSRDQWRRWSLPSKYTALGLLIAIAMIPVAIYGILPRSAERPHALYFAALNELFSNIAALDDCPEVKGCTPSGLSYVKVSDALSSQFDAIANDSYGEEKNLADLLSALDRSHGSRLADPARVAAARFENQFLAWYLTPTAMEMMTEKEKQSFATRLPLEQCVTDQKSYVVIDGNRVTCFADYLGYLDW